MKTPSLILTALLTLGLLTLAPVAQAAKQAAADKGAQKTARQAAVVKRGTIKDLKLTTEQKQQLKELRSQQREKTLAMRSEYERKLEGILTPDQLTKFKELKAGKAGEAPELPAQTAPPAKRKRNQPAAESK